MNRILRFLRNLDKRKLIFILQRASAVLLPIRPYPDCGRGHCPCPAIIYLDHVTWFGELRSAACDRRPVRTRTRITSHEGSSHTKKKGGMNYGSRT